MSAVGAARGLENAPPKRASVSLGGFFFIVLAASYILGGLGAVIRLRYGDLGQLTTGFQTVFLPLTLFVALAYLVSKKHFRLSWLSAVLLCLFVYAAMVGIAHNQLGGAFVSHCFEAIFAITLFTFGRALQWREPEVMRQGIRRLAKWVLWAHVPLMAAFLVFYSMGAVYFGMSASVLVISAAVMLRDKRYGMAMLAIALMLLTGKRGDLLGLIVALLAFFALTGRARYVGRGLLAAIGIVLAVGILVAATQAAFNLDLLKDITAKLEILGKLDLSKLDSAATRQAIGGRGMEIFVIYDALFTHGLRNLITGLGYGWSLQIDTNMGVFNETIHNVHVTPFDTIAQYGVVLAVVWWFAILKTIQHGFSVARRRPDMVAIVPYAVGMIAITMTAYAVSVDALFWLILGAISLPNCNVPHLGLIRADLPGSK